MSTILRIGRIGPEAVAEAEDRAPLSDLAYRALADAIIEGSIQPGAKLSEPDLARRFGISRGPLREAVRRLEGRGLVVRRPRAGVRAIALSRADIIDMFVVREALEGMAARLGAQRRTAEDIATLRRLVADQNTAIDTARLAARGVWSFHGAVARIAASPRIVEVLESDRYRLIRNYRHTARIATERGSRSVEEHRRIVDAIAAGDAELAELLMRRHIAAALMVLLDSLSQVDKPSGIAPVSNRET